LHDDEALVAACGKRSCWMSELTALPSCASRSTAPESRASARSDMPQAVVQLRGRPAGERGLSGHRRRRLLALQISQPATPTAYGSLLHTRRMLLAVRIPQELVQPPPRRSSGRRWCARCYHSRRRRYWLPLRLPDAVRLTYAITHNEPGKLRVTDATVLKTGLLRAAGGNALAPILRKSATSRPGRLPHLRVLPHWSALIRTS